MRRRTVLSATIGLSSMAGLTCVGVLPGLLPGSPRPDHEASNGMKQYSGSSLAFGTTVTIKVLHDNAAKAEAAIQYALQQVRGIDALMSLYQERSQVYQLNLHGRVDAPDSRLLHVLAFAGQLSRLTEGAFDITVQPLWRAFSLARAKGALPQPDELAAAKSLVNWQRLDVDEKQLRFERAGMAVTLNGLAQGYAVDLALDALRSFGIAHALLDTGEHGSIGRKNRGQPWILGISHPRMADTILAKIQMDGRKVATSGDYATVFSSDFVHHHIFDPASGDSPTALASVTVVAPTGLMADGLSTAFMVMGAEKALTLAARLPDIDTLLVHKNGTIERTAGFPQWQV
jgi:FAD:protein FMN transferase